MATLGKNQRRWIVNLEPPEDAPSMLVSRDRSGVFPANDNGRWER